MKMNLMFLLLSLTFLASCSGMKFKNIRNESEFDRYNKMAAGKNPKEVKDLIGQPMHAFYNKGKTVYQLAYPMAYEEVSMAGVMFNKELSCYWFNFNKNDEDKYIYEKVNFGKDTSCKVDHTQIEVSPSLID